MAGFLRAARWTGRLEMLQLGLQLFKARCFTRKRSVGAVGKVASSYPPRGEVRGPIWNRLHSKPGHRRRCHHLSAETRKPSYPARDSSPVGC